MLNTDKLIYILPDVAYLAELLPGKKEHTFTVQAFRQINGEFINEEELIPDNIEKLFSKVEADEYRIILPDFLFTNTIVEVGEIGDSKVKAYIKDTLIPSLNIDSTSHQIDTFALTEHQGKTKTQLSAVENSVLEPLARAAAHYKAKILSITPLSWSIKSVVSLEPSITIIQAGANLYLAEHYIGVDQAHQATVAELDTLAETVKTLKGAEPSLQTVYLLTNELVAENLKQAISSTLPVQQLASFKEDDTQMPSYLKQTVEAGMKTLSIPEYHAPVFVAPKVDAAALAPALVPPTPAAPPTPEKSDKVEKPASISLSDDELEDEIVVEDDEVESESESDVEEVSAPSKPADSVSADLPKPDLPIALPSAAEKPALPAPEVIALPTSVPKEEIAVVDLSEPDISQFAPHTDSVESHQAVTETEAAIRPEKVAATTETLSDVVPKPTQLPKKVIKNQSGVNSFLKMVGLTIVVFVLTVSVGVGLGLGFLKFSSNSKSTTQPSPSPLSSVKPSPSLAPSPTASAGAQLNKAKTKVLVVNATTVAGYAGKTKKQLEAAGFSGVGTGNAKDEYEPGTYVLMKTKDEALLSALESATELKMTYQANTAVEDPKGEYQAVIVLGE